MEQHWHEKKAFIQLDDDMLANKISLKMFLKLPSTQTYFCKNQFVETEEYERGMYQIAVKGHFRGPQNVATQPSH